MSNTLVGIDLGTTMSALAYLNGMGTPEVLPVDDDQYLLPSLIYFVPGRSEIKVGREARARAKEAPDRFISQVKRHMHDDQFSQSIDGKSWTAPELSSLILRKLAEGAAHEIGAVKDVVISVPAYFKDKQRDATVKAGELAGLNVVALVNEPTAAAIYYATARGISGTTLIFDMGGGTTDVTVLTVNGNDVQIKGSAGNVHLGGVDFDDALLKIIEKAYDEQHGGKLIEGESKRMIILQLSEDLKKNLTRKDKVTARAKGPKGGIEVSISRADFEKAIASQVGTAKMLVESALDDAGIESADVECVALVGGSTRIPAVRKAVQEIIGKEPVSVGNVDQAVAMGAAIYAGIRTMAEGGEVSAPIKQALGAFEVGEVTSFGLGTLCVQTDEITAREVEKNSILIEKNTPIPARMTNQYYTMLDGQTEILVMVTQGDVDDPELVDVIHEQAMKIPPGRRAGQPIDMTFEYDVSGLLHCHVKDLESGRTIEFDVHPPTGGKQAFAEKVDVIDSFVID